MWKKKIKIFKPSERQTKREESRRRVPQISEGEIISTMHKMVHQKVKSSEKWGFVEMTKRKFLM